MIEAFSGNGTTMAIPVVCFEDISSIVNSKLQVDSRSAFLASLPIEDLPRRRVGDVLVGVAFALGGVAETVTSGWAFVAGKEFLEENIADPRIAQTVSPFGALILQSDTSEMSEEDYLDTWRKVSGGSEEAVMRLANSYGRIVHRLLTVMGAEIDLETTVFLSRIGIQGMTDENSNHVLRSAVGDLLVRAAGYLLQGGESCS